MAPAAKTATLVALLGGTLAVTIVNLARPVTCRPEPADRPLGYLFWALLLASAAVGLGVRPRRAGAAAYLLLIPIVVVVGLTLARVGICAD